MQEWILYLKLFWIRRGFDSDKNTKRPRSYQICDHQQKRDNQDHHLRMFTVREMHGAGKSSDLHGITKRNTKLGLEIGKKKI